MYFIQFSAQNSQNLARFVKHLVLDNDSLMEANLTIDSYQWPVDCLITSIYFWPWPYTWINMKSQLRYGVGLITQHRDREIYRYRQTI